MSYVVSNFHQTFLLNITFSLPFLFSLPRLRLISRRRERCLVITCCTMLYLIGTGSFELRVDGSIHEWTIENQTPAGPAKLNFAALELAVFSVRVKTGTSSSAALDS